LIQKEGLITYQDHFDHKKHSTWVLPPTGDLTEAASQLYNALHKLDQLKLDVIIAEDFLIMVWEEPL
jgi:L-threonylcarbamoyladenylate synthase